MWLRALTVAGVIALLTSCESMSYYGQSVAGHFSLLGSAQPIDELLLQDGFDDSLKSRLQTVLEIRQFATETLLLPDNDSYLAYADIGRHAVLWTVVAAPEFSLTAETWCYPVIGCASYRGYFDHAAALQKADELRSDGYDVSVAEVPAYSTLGWFDDPLPSSVIRWDDARLADLIFHELAHQKLYLDGDSMFNESFATSVGRIGTERWLVSTGRSVDWSRYLKSLEQEAMFIELLADVRAQLEAVYSSDVADAEKRAAKQRILSTLPQRYEELAQCGVLGDSYEAWFSKPVNNARLALVSTYHRWVPAMIWLYERGDRNMAEFYRAMRELGQDSRELRDARLQVMLDMVEP